MRRPGVRIPLPPVFTRRADDSEDCLVLPFPKDFRLLRFPVCYVLGRRRLSLRTTESLTQRTKATPKLALN